MTSKQQKFVSTVWQYYDQNRRILPWREARSGEDSYPYKVLVSEVMLQQTQAQRVIEPYQRFIKRFPNIEDLAKANVGDVIREWQGLGYNRRAKYLHDCARIINSSHQNYIPNSIDGLVKLPGIGKNTAGAIVAYAYNDPAIFIETNVRTVYIHHFFEKVEHVSDAEIEVLLEQTVNRENPREWYWALMDYGTHLKKTIGNANKKSKHYQKQSKFEGSKRQVRGKILKLLSNQPLDKEDLLRLIDDQRVVDTLDDLCREGLIRKKGQRYCL